MNASLIARATAYALSAGAHVAIMVVTFGHAAPAEGASPRMTELSIEAPLDVVVPEPVKEPEPVANAVVKATGSPTPATHTHPYPVPLDHDAHPHDPNLVHAPLAAHDHDDEHAHEAPPAVVAPAPAARFTMRIATGGAAASGAPSGDVHGQGTGGAEAVGAPMAEAAVSTPARLVGAVTPAYPPAARASEIEADVALEIIVAKDGQVVSARVTKAAGYGFDDAAVRAVRAARFTPAIHHGAPVAVRMRWTVAFRLR